MEKKRRSKKTKRSWRKFADVEDVEEHLIETRQEERTGGIVADKPDSSLYFVDKDTSDQSLKKKSRKLPTKEESSDEEEFVSNKRKYRKPQKPPAEKEVVPIATYNPWGAGNNKEDDENLSTYVTDTLPKPVKKPATVASGHNDLVAAVDVCDAGASYNPEYDDHQKLLGKAHAIEFKKERAKELLDEKICYITELDGKKQPSWIDEMSEGLSSHSNVGTKEERHEKQQASGDGERLLDYELIKNSKAERKTRQQRRGAATEKSINAKKQKLSTIKQQMQDVYRLRSLGKELKEEEKQHEKRKSLRSSRKEQRKALPKTLGKHKFEEASVAIQLSDELTGSLRSLKPEGDLLLDRYKSLQKRSIIEPRKPVVPHRKYKRKEFDNKSYKELTIQEVKFTKKK